MNKITEESRRADLLLKMYDQMFNNINRHILITWEVVPVIGGALGAIALTKTQDLPVWVGGSIIVFLAGWLYAHSIDANEWVKRNLFIITNIERQFLKKDDEKQIHYYFSRPHKIDVIRQFQIQIAAAFVTASSAVIWVVVDAGQKGKFPGFFVAVLLGTVGFCEWFRWRTTKQLKKFAKKSPGIS